MLSATEASKMVEDNKFDAIEMELLRIEKRIKESIAKKHKSAFISFDYSPHPQIWERLQKEGYKGTTGSLGSRVYFIEINW